MNGHRYTTRPCPSCGSHNFKLRYVEGPFYIVKCSTCSLVYLGNPPDEDRLYEDYYGEAEPPADAYHPDSTFAALAELHSINEQRIACLKQLRPSGSLLDIGCGRGYFLKTAQEHGYHVAGTDVSEQAVRYARRYYTLNVSTATLADLIDRHVRSDIVTLWHVLEHFLDPFEALAQIRKLITEQGVCLVEVPNLYSLKFLLSKQKWRGGNHPLYHRTFFNSRTLQDVLKKSGFTQVTRLKLSYHIPGRRRSYRLLKRGLNELAMDAFIAFAARPS